jgi:HJR/Mrr/RecB family endonuclease
MSAHRIRAVRRVQTGVTPAVWATPGGRGVGNRALNLVVLLIISPLYGVVGAGLALLPISVLNPFGLGDFFRYERVLFLVIPIAVVAALVLARTDDDGDHYKTNPSAWNDGLPKQGLHQVPIANGRCCSDSNYFVRGQHIGIFLLARSEQDATEGRAQEDRIQPLQYWNGVALGSYSAPQMWIPLDQLHMRVTARTVITGRWLWPDRARPSAVLTITNDAGKTAEFVAFDSNGPMSLDEVERLKTRFIVIAKKIAEANDERELWMPERLLALNPTKFEQAVLARFHAIGVSATHVGMTGDGGVDVELTVRDELCVVQCKRHQERVAPSVVRELLGSMVIRDARLGAIVSVNGFTEGAKATAEGRRVLLLDYRDFARLTRSQLEQLQADP